MAANEIDRLLAESQSRLDGLLSATEANRVSLAKLSQVEKQRDELLEALEQMVSIAELVDGWESFPSDPIEVALKAIAKAKGEW